MRSSKYATIDPAGEKPSAAFQRVGSNGVLLTLMVGRVDASRFSR